MAWSTRRTYIAASERTIDWLRGERISFYHILPPDVPAPILSLGGPPVTDRAREQFETWATTADLEIPESTLTRLPADAELYGACPDRAELVELKWLAEQLQSPVAEYSAATWGGAVEYEWCWEFGPNERVLLNAEHTRQWDENYRDWLFRSRTRTKYRSWRVVYEIRHQHCQPVEVGDTEPPVLARMLQSFGVQSSGFFKPHGRAFDWARFRVDPSPV